MMSVWVLCACGGREVVDGSSVMGRERKREKCGMSERKLKHKRT